MNQKPSWGLPLYLVLVGFYYWLATFLIFLPSYVNHGGTFTTSRGGIVFVILAFSFFFGLANIWTGFFIKRYLLYPYRQIKILLWINFILQMAYALPAQNAGIIVFSVIFNGLLLKMIYPGLFMKGSDETGNGTFFDAEFAEGLTF